MSKDPLESCLIKGSEAVEVDGVKEVIAQLEACDEKKKHLGIEEINRGVIVRLKPSIKEPPKLEFTQLPTYLEYAFLVENSKLLVIISSGLDSNQKEKLLSILKEHKKAIAWTISNIKGITPSFCTHKILMEEGFKTVVQP